MRAHPARTLSTGALTMALAIVLIPAGGATAASVVPGPAPDTRVSAGYAPVASGHGLEAARAYTAGYRSYRYRHHYGGFSRHGFRSHGFHRHGFRGHGYPGFGFYRYGRHGFYGSPYFGRRHHDRGHLGGDHGTADHPDAAHDRRSGHHGFGP